MLTRGQVRSFADFGAAKFACVIVCAIAAATPSVWCQDIPPHVIERAKHATVMVGTFASQKEKADTQLGTGTGYFVNGSGLLITNNHVVDPAHGKSLRERQKFQYTTNRLSYKVIMDSGTKLERILDTELLYQSLTADQALLQVKDETGEMLKTPDFLRLLPTELIKLGTKVCAIGFPGGNSQRVSRRSNAEVSLSYGAVTDVPRAPSGRVRQIKTDAIARPGNSGGPMVDTEGFVVGTVTLLGQTEDQANTCMLVPSSLTQAFIRDAIRLERVPAGSDLVPLLDAVGTPNERLTAPQFNRHAEHDVLFLDNGEQVHGNIENKAVSLHSPLGRLDVPVESMAYAIKGNNGVALFLEGGDYILASDSESKLHFSATGGRKVDATLGEFQVVGYRFRNAEPRSPKGELIALNTDAGRLLLADAKGEASFASLAGVDQIKLADIARIESGSDGKQQELTLVDGRKIMGRFGGGGYTALLAATGTPIHFELNQLQWARLDRMDAGDMLPGSSLLRIVAGADVDLLAAAKLMEEGSADEARAKLQPWLEPARFGRLGEVTKAQVRLLDAMVAVGGGDADALSKLRKCVERKDERVAAYARGCIEVLKRFGAEYEGKPLSDRDVFRSAGWALGRELIGKGQDLLKDRATLKGKKGEYSKYMNRIAEQEKAMQAAAVLAGSDADDVLIDLLKFALQLCETEYTILKEEFDGIRGGRSRVGPQDASKLAEIRRKAEKVVTVWQAHYTDLEEYGFYYSKSPGFDKFPD